MSDQVVDSSTPADLRFRAGSRLAGAAGAKASRAGAADALAVLHALASSPATAADALALLHELQVHQVELDLQAEELRESRAGLEAALRRETERHDALPAGCFTIDGQLRIVEVNRAGAAMLGIAREQAHGMGLEAFVATDSQRRLREALAKVTAGSRHASCTIDWRPQEGGAYRVCVELGADPSGSGFLVVVVPAADGAGPAPG